MQPVSAPAKIILFGEHAVVYGYPAIAVPVCDVRITAQIKPAEALRVVSLDMHDHPLVVYPQLAGDDAVSTITRLALQYFDESPPPITIEINSQIPVASGLGSGAALSAVIARALAAHFGKSLQPDTLNDMVFQTEKLHHGTPSGIDNTVIVYEKPVYFRRSQPIEIISRIGKRLTFLIGDTGEKALTHVSVGDVRKLRDMHPDEIEPILYEIGSIAERARTAIEQGDVKTIGELMTQNHELLQRLTVSSPSLDTLVTSALDAGAYGAKLSGGGRGGNMIALVDEDHAEPVKDVLLQSGAVNVLTTHLLESD